MELGPTAPVTPALKLVFDGLTRVVLTVELVAGREMALEPELLQLTLHCCPELLP